MKQTSENSLGFLAQILEEAQHYNTQVVLAGVSLLAACAGVIGCFAVLRRRSLTGDALAHAALPGVCLAFLMVGEKSLLEMLLGALLTGLLGISVITFLRHWTRLKDDAAIGIVLGVFFGAGSVLSSIIQKMEGQRDRAGLSSFIYGKTAGILYDDVVLIGFLTLAALGVVVLFFKEFKLVSFDPAFAKVQGWPALGLDLMLMTLVAIAVIIGLPAVGVVMMAALLILPAVTARYWTNRLHILLLLAGVCGALMGLIGTLLSAVDRRLPAGPAIILVGAAFFVLSMLFAPRRGALARLLDHWRFQRQLRAAQLPLPNGDRDDFVEQLGQGAGP